MKERLAWGVYANPGTNYRQLALGKRDNSGHLALICINPGRKCDHNSEIVYVYQILFPYTHQRKSYR